MSATSTPYVSGMKKPLNLLVGPVYPDIKKGPPRFVWSRKHWDVDVGATMMDTEPFTQLVEPAILAQSRSYNKTVYGQSSHRDIVNAEFRPPLMSYYEDIGPLNRVPATINPIIPRINPGSAGHGAGTSGYTSKNERISDIEGALTDRIKAGEWRPTFYAPMDIPIDNSVLPDLEAKIPSVSVHSGWNYPSYNTQEHRSIDLGNEKLQAIPIKTGHSSGVNIDGPRELEKYQAYDNRPTYSAGSGVNTPMELNTPLPVETFELFHNRPQFSADAGMNTPAQINAETPTVELFHNQPQVSADAGMNTPAQINSETPTVELFHNRPQVSAGAGTNTLFQINAETPTVELFEKLGETPINVLNPGSETGYTTEASIYSNKDEYIQENRPSYSYVVPQEEPIYRSRNEETHKPHFREKLQPLKSYGKVAQSSGAIPKAGVEMYREALRENIGGRKPNRYEVNKKKTQYKF